MNVIAEITEFPDDDHSVKIHWKLIMYADKGGHFKTTATVFRTYLSVQKFMKDLWAFREAQVHHDDTTVVFEVGDEKWADALTMAEWLCPNGELDPFFFLDNTLPDSSRDDEEGAEELIWDFHTEDVLLEVINDTEALEEAVNLLLMWTGHEEFYLYFDAGVPYLGSSPPVTIRCVVSTFGKV